MKKKHILMLEGDENDRELCLQYFNEYDIDCRFVARSNEVAAFLENQKEHEMPRLILLSMKSVPDTGLMVLKKVKSDRRYKHIPVIMLGENTQGNIIKLCYAEGANSFVNKPFTDQMTDLKIRAFIRYWFEVAEFADADVSSLVRM